MPRLGQESAGQLAWVNTAVSAPKRLNKLLPPGFIDRHQAASPAFLGDVIFVCFVQYTNKVANCGALPANAVYLSQEISGAQIVEELYIKS